VLTVTGDGADNTISLGRGDGGVILINGGAVAIDGGTPSIRNTSSILVLGQGGSDHLVLDEASGLPAVAFSGGDGVDSVEVNSANLNEVFAMAPTAGRVRLERTSPAPFTVDMDTTEAVVLNMNAGDDTFNGSTGVAALIQSITIDAGDGNDTIFGTDVAEVFIGGNGDDTIDGNRGNDLGLMGTGDDTFIWDPGDGNDTIEGQDGNDRMLFNGANVAENIDVSANGGRVRFFRNVANIVMDLNDVEAIDFNALGGSDSIVVNDLSGTDMREVSLNLAAAGGAPDGVADSVIVNGTSGNDVVELFGSHSVTVAGLSSGVSVLNSDGALDTLTVNLLGGEDSIDASKLAANLVKLTEDGGAGNDTLVGSRGADVLLGNDGDDTLLGFKGDDQVFGNAGDDRVIWNPGDDTDVNEGGDGFDTVEVNGLDVDEVFAVAPNGGRVRLERSVPTTAPFSIDIGTSENLVVNMNGGNDTFNGSNGIAALLQKVTVDGGAGNDRINGTDVAEVLIGGDGNDTIDGNRGNDLGLMGAGDDTFIWDPGDGSDTIEGQDGRDRMLFNGANVAENFDVAANGGRVRFIRNVANIVMDLDNVEQIDLNALGGADNIVVNDLSGTDMLDVNLELASTLGGFAGDGAADAIVVNGTNGDDHISVARTNGNVVVSGLPATVSIGASEGALDTLRVNGLGGDDTLDASGLPAGRIGLTFEP
jgi:Ca2+-binding RTX toxin-like protein